MAVTIGCAQTGIDAVLATLIGESRISAGVREAVRVCAERGVARASRPGGFWEDPDVRIPLPPELEPIARTLRSAGLQGTVDEIEESMNRAAEQASGEAAELLIDAAVGMTIKNARDIVEGPDDAATRYFRARTEAELRARFAPIVARTMRRVGLHRAYDELVARNRLVSGLGDPTVALEEYVTNAALDGLFTVLRQEERRIRRDPTARTTELLREVFGDV